MHATLDDFYSDFTVTTSKLEKWQKLALTRLICSFAERLTHKYLVMNHEQRELWSNEVMANDYPAPTWYLRGRHNTYQYSNFLGKEDGIDQVVRGLCHDAPNCEVMQQAYDLFYNYVFGMDYFSIGSEELIEVCRKLCAIIGN